MGYYDESDERKCSYRAPDRYVCPDCVTDPYLARMLAAELQDEQCSYCGAARAADISVLCDEIRETIELEYTDPAEELPYVSREGGYQGEVLTGSDIICFELDPWTDRDDLADDVAEAFAENFLCRRDYFGLDRYEALDYSWQTFTEQVKHHTRYLFLQELDPERYQQIISPGEMLANLGQLFQEFELFSELPQSTNLFRARVYSGRRPVTAAELGTAPREAAVYPNRMSPAGISMFYAARDEVTAVLETYDPQVHQDQEIAIARFINNRPLAMLNLVELPALPSQFDRQQRHEHPRIAFLRAFERDLTKAVDRTTKAHTEYVPTQVVTEFVRHRLRTPAGEPIDGILYRSSRCRESIAIVIFANPEHCGPRTEERFFSSKPFLELVDARYTRYSEFEDQIQKLQGEPCIDPDLSGKV